ncbi:Regulator of telomere elongation helicase [Salix suchowensis]|nr:Regulator of telomere elongation helicase [Salix suchowensis]
MMSLFSSFDALIAESFGQKLRLSFSASKEGNSHNDKSSSSKSCPVNINKPLQPQKMRLRFAPELDGVHCFETIITY